MACFKGFNVGFFGQEIFDVVKALTEALFFISVDVEVFALACGKVGDGLRGEVYAYLCLGVFGYGVKDRKSVV